MVGRMSENKLNYWNRTYKMTFWLISILVILFCVFNALHLHCLEPEISHFASKHTIIFSHIKISFCVNSCAARYTIQQHTVKVAIHNSCW